MTETQTKHTPLPWFPDEDRYAPGSDMPHAITAEQLDDDGYPAIVAYTSTRADADLVYRAVNSHADLLEACRAIVDQADDGDGFCCGVDGAGKAVFKGSFIEHIEAARAAIRKATGGEG